MIKSTDSLAQRPSPESKNIVTSVVKALRLLECFNGAAPELSLAELAQLSGLNKTTTHRLLASLKLAGWVDQGAAGSYRLTLRVFELGSSVLANIDLRREVAPEMSKLAADFGETVYLVVAEDEHAVCLERVEGKHQVRVMALDVGRTMPLYMGAGPLALLAAREEELIPLVLERWTQDGLVGGIITEKQLRQNLAETRRKGYALSLEDVTPGVAAIGTTILDYRGQAVAALSLGGLKLHFTPARISTMSTALIEAAQRVSARLGHSAGAKSS